MYIIKSTCNSNKEFCKFHYPYVLEIQMNENVHKYCRKIKKFHCVRLGKKYFDRFDKYQAHLQHFFV